MSINAGYELKGERAAPRIRFLLDSGANESMMKHAKWAKRTWDSNIEIKTADPSKSIDSGLRGEVEMTNGDGTAIPGLETVLFTSNLRENLLSVGRLTDAGYTVVFNACGVKIYKNRGLRVSGHEIHHESRDNQGLYPLTLTPAPPIAQVARAPPQEVRANLATAVATAQQVLRNAREERATKNDEQPPAQKLLPAAAPAEILGTLARIYPKVDMSVLEKWHTRCGHASVKALKRMGISELQGKKIPNKHRCEACIKGKVHRMPHKEMHNLPKASYLPGQCIATDLMGPYARTIEGSKYAQLYKCTTSKFRWLCTYATKDLTVKATANVLIDAKARSGRDVKFLKTDGDGIFRSAQFAQLQAEHGFVHERAAPHDHNSNAEIERDIRTVFEGTSTALQCSGAPSSFWADAMHHFVFTKNVLPMEVKDAQGNKVMKAPKELLDPQAASFNLDYLVAFGTQCTCYIPVQRREGGKQPGQQKAYKGMIIGYIRDMPAYKVYDFETRKKRESSFTMTFIHEGFFPYLQAKNEESVETTGKDDPLTFYPTREAALDEREWQTYEYDQAEATEAWQQGATWSRSVSKDSAGDYSPWWLAISDAQPQQQGYDEQHTVSGSGVTTGGVPPTTNDLRGSPTVGDAVGQLTNQIGQLYLENKMSAPQMQEAETKNALKEVATSTQPGAAVPFQAGDGGFLMLNDAQDKQAQGRTYTVPEYRRTALAPVQEQIQTPRRDAPQMHTDALLESMNMGQRPVQHQWEDVTSWATQLGSVTKPRKMVVLNLPKKSQLTEQKSQSGVDTERRYPNRVRKPKVFNAVTENQQNSEAKMESIVCKVKLDKPAGIPPPKTLGEAKKSAWWQGYRQAITDEITNLEALGCWDVIAFGSVPKGANIMRSKFVFDDKRASDGKLVKFKARLVAMGFTQIEGVDYDETFASVMTTKSFRTLLAIWNLDPTYAMEHWDIKQAFVNAPLSQTLYVYPVPGFGMDGKVLKLKKALYGTKQAAHEWQAFLRSKLVAIGGVPCIKDECVYMFRENDSGGWLYLSTHVDDLFPLYNTQGRRLRDKILAQLQASVTVEARGDVAWALSTKIERDAKRGVLKISQEEDINSLLREFGFITIATAPTPMIDKGADANMTEDDLPKTEAEKQAISGFQFRNIIGKIWWLALISRPDVALAVHRCACWQNEPSMKLKRWVMRIVSYLKGTKHLGLVFERNKYDEQMPLMGMSDASFASDKKSKSRYATLFYCAGALVHWASSKTSRIVSSTTEAEVHGLVHLGKENIWEREFHSVLQYFAQMPPTVVYQDNTAAIALSTGAPKHKRSKHFGIEFDMFKEYVQLGEMKIEHMQTDELTADMLTKPLSVEKFEKFRGEMMGDERAQMHFIKRLK